MGYVGRLRLALIGQPAEMYSATSFLLQREVARLASNVRASNEHLPQFADTMDPACRVPRAQEADGPPNHSSTRGEERFRYTAVTKKKSRLI
jgi:hypothetical protein